MPRRGTWDTGSCKQLLSNQREVQENRAFLARSRPSVKTHKFEQIESEIIARAGAAHPCPYDCSDTQGCSEGSFRASSPARATLIAIMAESPDILTADPASIGLASSQNRPPFSSPIQSPTAAGELATGEIDQGVDRTVTRAGAAALLGCSTSTLRRRFEQKLHPEKDAKGHHRFSTRRIEELKVTTRPRGPREYSTEEARRGFELLARGAQPSELVTAQGLHPLAARAVLESFAELGGGIFLTCDHLTTLANSLGSEAIHVTRPKGAEAVVASLVRRLRVHEATNNNLLEELRKARAQLAALSRPKTTSARAHTG